MLEPLQIASYAERGYLVLEDLIDVAQVAVLREMALQVIDDFDVVSRSAVFSAREGEEMRDAYFYESAEKVRCFLEADAVDAAGSVVVLHDHLPHCSSHNHSSTPRHAFSLHVKPGSAQWSQGNWLQRRTLQPFRL